MSQRTSAAVKKSDRHSTDKSSSEDIRRIRLKRSDFSLLEIPKSARKVGTPHVEPTVSLRLMTMAVDWVAKERERLLKEAREADAKKK